MIYTNEEYQKNKETGEVELLKLICSVQVRYRQHRRQATERRNILYLCGTAGLPAGRDPVDPQRRPAAQGEDLPGEGGGQAHTGDQEPGPGLGSVLY